MAAHTARVRDAAMETQRSHWRARVASTWIGLVQCWPPPAPARRRRDGGARTHIGPDRPNDNIILASMPQRPADRGRRSGIMTYRRPRLAALICRDPTPGPACRDRVAAQPARRTVDDDDDATDEAGRATTVTSATTSPTCRPSSRDDAHHPAANAGGYGGDQRRPDHQQAARDALATSVPHRTRIAPSARWGAGLPQTAHRPALRLPVPTVTRHRIHLMTSGEHPDRRAAAFVHERDRHGQDSRALLTCAGRGHAHRRCVTCAAALTSPGTSPNQNTGRRWSGVEQGCTV